MRDNPAMMIESLAEVQAAVSGAWAADTCDPVDLADWHPGNPARGQCGVTALVLNDLFGGDLVMAEVLRSNGTRQGVHYWNRVGSVELDLTREQFTDAEHVGPGAVVVRPSGPPRRCPEKYELLRGRVLAALATGDS